MESRERIGRLELANRIFSDAIGLPTHQRAAFVQRESQSDPELGDSVMRLLSDFDRLGSFLQSPAVAHPAAHAEEFRSGDVLSGRFKIAERLGGGGMGEVYRVEDLELGEVVALKTVRPAWRRDPGMLARFREEIRLARRISHPHVCKIFDLFTHEGPDGAPVLFFTMEYLDGDTLSDRLRSGRLPREEALALAEQIASGLDAAHAAGILHRDLKPANILLVHRAGSTRAVITDFGLARSVLAELGHGDLTQTGQILGSPDYMAPEQFEEGEITAAADVFAFGLIVFEMLCGRKAYPTGNLFRAALARLTGAPASLRQYAPDVPTAWDRALAKCLARDPSTRYASAADLLKDLGGGGTFPKLPVMPLSRRSLLWAGTGAAGLAGMGAFYRYYNRTPLMPASPLVMLTPLTHASGDSVETGAVDLIFRNELAQSAHIRMLSSGDVEEAWRHAANAAPGEKAPAVFEPPLAREIALRKGAQIAVFGNLARVADRRVLMLQVELLGGRPGQSRKNWSNQFTANRASDLASISHDAAGWMRRTIGESAEEIGTRNRPMEDFTTPYWAALEEFVQANQAWTSGQQDAAVLHLKAALRVDPGFALAAARMADILLSSGQTDEAYQYWDKAAKMLGDRNLTDRESLRIRGLFALDTGQAAEAEQIFSRYVLEFPGDALPLFYKASAQERLGKSEAAEQSFGEAIQKDPAYAFVMGRATYYLGQGRVAEAERDWRTGQAGEPLDWTERIRGALDFARADMAGVRRSIDRLKSASRPPFRSKAYSVEACFECELGNLERAAEALGEGIAYDRRTGQPAAAEQEKLLLKAELLLLRSRYGEAVQAGLAGLAASPGLIMRMRWGRVLAQAGGLREAAKCLPDSLPEWSIYQGAMHRLKGEIAFARREFEEALEHFQSAVEPAAKRVWPAFLVRGALAAGREDIAQQALVNLFQAPGLYWLGAELNDPGFVRQAAALVLRHGKWADLTERARMFSKL